MTCLTCPEKAYRTEIESVRRIMRCAIPQRSITRNDGAHRCIEIMLFFSYRQENLRDLHLKIILQNTVDSVSSLGP